RRLAQASPKEKPKAECRNSNPIRIPNAEHPDCVRSYLDSVIRASSRRALALSQRVGFRPSDFGFSLMRSKRAIMFLYLAGMLAGLQIRTQAQEAPPSEYQLKAAFLFNFAKFVEWPADVFPEPDSPFVIGILGENPFESDLEHAVKGKAISGHPFVVNQLKT